MTEPIVLEPKKGEFQLHGVVSVVWLLVSGCLCLGALEYCVVEVGWWRFVWWSLVWWYRARDGVKLQQPLFRTVSWCCLSWSSRCRQLPRSSLSDHVFISFISLILELSLLCAWCFASLREKRHHVRSARRRKQYRRRERFERREMVKGSTVSEGREQG